MDEKVKWMESPTSLEGSRPCLRLEDTLKHEWKLIKAVDGSQRCLQKEAKRDGGWKPKVVARKPDSSIMGRREVNNKI